MQHRPKPLLLTGLPQVGAFYWGSAIYPGMTKRSTCGGAGCDVEKYAQIVRRAFPDAANANASNVIDSSADHSGVPMMTATDAFPNYFLPGIRLGIYNAPEYSPGTLVVTPRASDKATTSDHAGPWIAPDRRYCNPLEWTASSKTCFAHTGMPADSDGLEKKSGPSVTHHPHDHAHGGSISDYASRCADHKAHCLPQGRLHW